MAFPFGHPSLGTFLSWANGQGCAVQWGYELGIGVVRITNPSTGKSFRIVDVPQEERLLPKTTAYYCDRLGLIHPPPGAW